LKINPRFDTETENIDVAGVDNIDEDVEITYEEYTEKSKTYRIYELKDDTGNVLKMKMEYKKRPNTLDIEILELIYNDEIETPQRNNFHIVCIYKKELKNLVQHLKIDMDEVNVKYHPKKDESIITRKGGTEKRDGLVLIVLRTEKGTLSYIVE